MSKIVWVEVLIDLSKSALAAYLHIQMYIASLMDAALLTGTNLVQFIFKCFSVHSLSRIYIASVYKLKYSIKNFSWVSLDIQIEKWIIIVEFIKLNSQLIDTKVSRFPFFVLCLSEKSFKSGNKLMLFVFWVISALAQFVNNFPESIWMPESLKHDCDKAVELTFLVYYTEVIMNLVWGCFW